MLLLFERIIIDSISVAVDCHDRAMMNIVWLQKNT